MAKITCGVNAAENGSFDGMTIAQVMEQYGQFLNIPQNNLVILVNDEEEDDTSYVIQSNDEIEFVKTAGEKGADSTCRDNATPTRLAPGAVRKNCRSVQVMSMRDIRKERVKRRNNSGFLRK